MGIKKIFNDIAVLLSVPVIYLNLFAGIIAFVWLIILGKWFLIIVSIVALFSHYLLGILMMPATLVQLLAFKAYEKKQVFFV